MRALTLIQPWGYAIEHLGKNVENRSWKPPDAMLGRYLAIHCGKKLDRETVEDLRADGHTIDDAKVHLGAITAIARLAGWVEGEGFFDHERTVLGSRWCNGALGVPQSPEVDLSIVTSRWWAGPIGWVLDSVRPLRSPVPCNGALGLWTVPPQIEIDVRQFMRAA